MRKCLIGLALSWSVACASTRRSHVATQPAIDTDSLIRAFASINGHYMQNMGVAFIPSTVADGEAYFGAVRLEKRALPALVECVGHAEASRVTNRDQTTSLGSLCSFAIIETHWFQTRLQRGELPTSWGTSMLLESSMETAARHSAVRDTLRVYLAGDDRRTDVDSTDIPPLIESAEVIIPGRVIDVRNGKPVPGAAVVVAPAGGQITFPVTVDSAGRFAVRLRQPGLYTFITHHDGFNDGRVDLTLPIPANREIEISIVPKEGRRMCLDYCPITGDLRIRDKPN